MTKPEGEPAKAGAKRGRPASPEEASAAKRAADCASLAYQTDPATILPSTIRTSGGAQGAVTFMAPSSSAPSAARARAAFAKLLEENVAPYYDDWAKERRTKARQMKSKRMRAIVVRGFSGDADDDAVDGFVAYRFEEDEGRPVVYIYEIQVSQRCRSRGLGGALLDAAEKLGAAVGMTHVVLTVHRANKGALRLYERRGMAEDWTSPGKCDPGEDYAYMIMSKEIQRPPDGERQEDGHGGDGASDGGGGDAAAPAERAE
ncbi:unnamed protein product [Pedinophyceae sp. YPF-701]|nr:unnamed protein product [Pedinophyceae sp. YPF-701]